jgi:AmmeMemoRadiSam system protein A
MTSQGDRQRLLQIARAAIAAHVNGTSGPDVDHQDLDGPRAGAFVTLHLGGQLRGCIGHIEADDLLPRVIARCAVSACSTDPRFPAIARSEVDLLSIELSILGPLEPIGGPHDIEIGRHGLVIEKGWQRGLLLPQVATEWHWDPVQFLEHTCRKAGLPPDAWKHHATMWKFDAEVFGEPEGAGRAGGTGGTGGTGRSGGAGEAGEAGG